MRKSIQRLSTVIFGKPETTVQATYRKARDILSDETGFHPSLPRLPAANRLLETEVWLMMEVGMPFTSAADI